MIFNTYLRHIIGTEINGQRLGDNIIHVSQYYLFLPWSNGILGRLIVFYGGKTIYCIFTQVTYVRKGHIYVTHTQGPLPSHYVSTLV